MTFREVAEAVLVLLRERREVVRADWTFLDRAIEGLESICDDENWPIDDPVEDRHAETIANLAQAVDKALHTMASPSEQLDIETLVAPAFVANPYDECPCGHARDRHRGWTKPDAGGCVDCRCKKFGDELAPLPERSPDAGRPGYCRKCLAHYKTRTHREKCLGEVFSTPMPVARSHQRAADVPQRSRRSPAHNGVPLGGLKPPDYSQFGDLYELPEQYEVGIDGERIVREPLVGNEHSHLWRIPAPNPDTPESLGRCSCGEVRRFQNPEPELEMGAKRHE